MPFTITNAHDVTSLAFIANVTEVWPAGTVTVAGRVIADELELERATTTPPGGAVPAKVTVPVADCPP